MLYDGKACLQIQIIVLLLRKLIIVSYKQNEKHPFTYKLVTSKHSEV